MMETPARGCYLPHVMLNTGVRQEPMSPQGASFEQSRIAVVDDDESVREALRGLLRSAGFGAETYGSAEEFLRSGGLEETECLILDVRMPGMGGLELQRKLSAADCRVPIIFITAHDDEDARARALKAGAIDVLHKPFSEEALLSGIHTALGQRAQ